MIAVQKMSDIVLWRLEEAQLAGNFLQRNELLKEISDSYLRASASAGIITAWLPADSSRRDAAAALLSAVSGWLPQTEANEEVLPVLMSVLTGGVPADTRQMLLEAASFMHPLLASANRRMLIDEILGSPPKIDGRLDRSRLRLLSRMNADLTPAELAAVKAELYRELQRALRGIQPAVQAGVLLHDDCLADLVDLMTSLGDAGSLFRLEDHVLKARLCCCLVDILNWLTPFLTARARDQAQAAKAVLPFSFLANMAVRLAPLPMSLILGFSALRETALYRCVADACAFALHAADECDKPGPAEALRGLSKTALCRQWQGFAPQQAAIIIREPARKLLGGLESVFRSSGNPLTRLYLAQAVGACALP